MATLPLIRFDSLPVSGSDGSNATMVAVIGNTNTVRIRWSDLTSKFAVITTGDLGGDTESDFAIREDGVFSRHNTVWGKSPRYKYENWGDLTKDTRFLKVDSEMNLSENELNVAWKNLNLNIASSGSVGVIKGAKPTPDESIDTDPVDGRLPNSVYISESGVISLPVANHTNYGLVKLDNEFIATNPISKADTAITGQYAHYAISHAISKLWRTPATNSSIGMVMGGTEPNSVNVDEATGAMTVSMAITPGVNKPGLTYLAHGTYQAWYANKDIESSWAAPASLVSEMVEHKMLFHQIPAKYNTRLGAVMPTVNILCGEDGDIYVQSATTSKDGVVVLAPHQFAGYDRDAIVYYYGNKVPDIRSLNSFINTCGFVTDDQIVDGIPVASASAIGGIKTSETIYVNESGAAYVPTANHSSLGVCKVFGVKDGTVPVAANYYHVMYSLGPASMDRAGTVQVRGAVYKGSNYYPTVISADEFDSSVKQAASQDIPGIVKVSGVQASTTFDYVTVPSYSEFNKSLAPATSTTPGRVLVSGNLSGAEYPVVATVEDIASLAAANPVAGDCETFDITGSDSVVAFSGDLPNVSSRLLYYRLGTNASIKFKAGSSEASMPAYNKVSYNVNTDDYMLDFDIAVETTTGNNVTFEGWVIIDDRIYSIDYSEEAYVYRFKVNYDTASDKWLLRFVCSYSAV